MFIARNPDGTIYGAWTQPQKHIEGVEELPDDHPDVAAFMDRAAVTKKPGPLSIEALVDALVAKEGGDTTLWESILKARKEALSSNEDMIAEKLI